MNYLLNNGNSNKEVAEALKELKKAIFNTLETYSNVHRGTGHNSLVTTALYEQARVIILEYLQLDNSKYVVIFCSPLRSEIFKKQLSNTNYQIVSSEDFGLPLGIRAIAVKKKDLRKCSVIFTGGGMIKHVTSNYVVWADIPERFEAGTPSIINIIALAKMVQKNKKFRNLIKRGQPNRVSTSKEILYQDEIFDYSGYELLLKLKNLLIGYDIHVPTTDGTKRFINLDNAASTRSFLPIWKTYCKILQQPKEKHREIIQEVKKICLKFLNATSEKYDIIFTSNTTEAINIVARSFSKLSKKDIEPVIINTILEHHSNELPFRYIPGVSLIRISVDNEGFIDLNELEDVLHAYNKDHKFSNKRVQLVAVSGCSNVLGTYNDLQKIIQITHKYGAELLVDGAQVVAHHKVDMSNTDIDYFIFSGHKAYAPFGTGALIVKIGCLKFDSSELIKIKLSGEENLAGIATIGKAILLLERVGIDTIESYEKKLTKSALNKLNKFNEIEIFGIKSSKSPKLNKRGGIISFNLKKVPNNIAAKELAEYGGIGVRNGCFCAHMLIQQILKIQQIRILGARMTSIIFPKQTELCLPGALRVSFGIENDENDIDILLKTIKRINQKSRSMINSLLARTYNGTLFVPKTITEEKIKRFVKLRIEKIFPA